MQSLVSREPWALTRRSPAARFAISGLVSYPDVPRRYFKAMELTSGLVLVETLE
jgi:hypothetical protein